MRLTAAILSPVQPDEQPAGGAVALACAQHLRHAEHLHGQLDAFQVVRVVETLNQVPALDAREVRERGIGRFDEAAAATGAQNPLVTVRAYVWFANKKTVSLYCSNS